MAVDKNKVIAEATKLVQKGAFDKAIKAYEKILGEDAKDVRILLKVGELQQKKGDNASAAETFSRVADAYGEQGFFLKAVAVYKQMMKLAPDDIRVNERLASLYQQLGILSDAMGQLQIVASAAEKAGDEPKLLDVLRRMTELDPDNVGSAVKLGELYAKKSQTKPALEHLRRAAEQLKRNNRAEEYVKVAERICFLAPDDLALTRELANIYLAKSDTKRALAKLQLCFKADPKDVDTLTLLAQAFKDLGQVSKTVSVYRELAHLYAEKGRAEEARSTWRRVLELAPDDAEAAHEVSPPAAPARPAPAPTAPKPAVRAPMAGPPPGAQRAVPPSPASPAPSPPPAAPAPQKPAPESVPKLLTETDVYVKYGLHDKALEHLKKVFAIDPDHLDAHEKALQLRTLRKDAAGAAEEAVKVARIALSRGLEDRARAAVARLREIKPDHPELAALVGGSHAVLEDDVELVEDGEELVLEVEPPVPAEADDIALAAAGEPVEEAVEEEPAATEAMRPHVQPSPPAPAAPIAARVPTSPRTAVTAPAQARETAPLPLHAPSAAVPAAGPRAAQPRPVRTAGEERPAPTPAAARPPAPPAPVVAPPPPVIRASPVPPVEDAVSDDDEEDLDDEIEEVDFFIQQGLLDEAREALQNLLSFYPDHVKLGAKLADLERRASPPPAPAAASPLVPGRAPAGEEGFDIARELAEELGASPGGAPAEDEFQYSAADVFDQFKKGVAQTVKAEDSETHYDLGIAYKEMGLLDDAVHEFEVALTGKGRKKEVDCLTMIGLCRMEKGDATGAVQAYQRALRSDYLTPESARAVHYEIAGAYEKAGDPEAALHFLHKVLKGDPGYRDAKAIVARLGGGPGRAPANGDAARSPQDEGHAAGGQRKGPKKNIGFV